MHKKQKKGKNMCFAGGTNYALRTGLLSVFKKQNKKKKKKKKPLYFGLKTLIKKH